MRSDIMRQIDLQLNQRLNFLSEELNRVVQRTLLGVVTPNAQYCFNLKKFRKLSEVKSLCITSWYLDESSRILLQEDLRFFIKRFEWKDQTEVLILLSSKRNMLEYLSTFSWRILFGNLFKTIQKDSERLRFVTTTPNRSKRKVRRRGYNDKGSCRPEHRWLPDKDYSLDLLQDQIESERRFQSDTHSSIMKYGVLGIRLPSIE